MRAITLAFSFIRVPKLFASLLLWPLLIGIIIAACQTILVTAYLEFVGESSEQFEKRMTSENTSDKWLRLKLYGSSADLGEIQLCRWIETSGGEQAPEGCETHRLDISLQVSDPEEFDPQQFLSFFNGSAQRLHLCKNCSSDITLQLVEGEVLSSVKSLSALGVYMLADTMTASLITQHFIEAKRTSQDLKSIHGTVYLKPAGFEHQINISNLTKTMLLVLNIAFLVIITLWLALKGHRKVLDYFARNDALLPLVAACGKDTFYNSLWLITLLRVGFFLMAALPATYLVFTRSVPAEILQSFGGEDYDFALWVAAIVSSLSAITIVASVGDLKHRHSLVSFLYRYVPMFVCIVGTLGWFLTVFFEGPLSFFAQKAIASLPVVGLSPVILSPIFKLDPDTMILHAILSSALALVVLRFNSRWFAAHLEEL